MKLENLTIRYGTQQIINSINLEINDCEIFVLMGPSGSGKTTLLRGIIGLTPITAGAINWSGEKGNVGIVFQEPRLFPHMNVIDNLAFGLRASGYSKTERYKVVDHYLDILQLRGLETRFPHELSGGQKQRVSLGRAIVLNPTVLLLDEPFSSLDTPLRYDLTDWLYQIQRDQGFSILWVTHYLDEAFSVADRIGVLIDGRLRQVGEPLEVYHSPSSEEVAAFFSLPNRFLRDTWSELFPKLSIPAESEMGWIPADALWLVNRGESFEEFKVESNLLVNDGIGEKHGINKEHETEIAIASSTGYLHQKQANGRIFHNSIVAWFEGEIYRVKHVTNGHIVVVNSKYGKWNVFVDTCCKCPEINDVVKVVVPFNKINWYYK